MTNLVLALVTFVAILQGSVTYYNKGVMEDVYRNRLAWGHVEPCKECIGMVAVLDRKYVGQHAYISLPGQTPIGPFLIVDCAAERDKERLRRKGRVAEVDWPTALKWRMNGPVDGATVFIMEDQR